MADDYGKMLKEDLGALKQYLQQQQQIVDTSRPTGIFANVDPVMLGVAKGFLSPTRTGGFGESIGLGLAGAEAPLEAMRKRQMDAQEKIINARLTAARLENEAAYNQARFQHLLSTGRDTTNQQRLLLTAQQNALKDKDWDEAVNPDTGEPFASEEDFKSYKNSIDSALFALNREARGATTEPTAKPKKAEQPATTEKKPEAAAKSDTPPADFPDARKGVDGAWYVPDPNRPGKYLKVQ